jgi:hypothetical protein
LLRNQVSGASASKGVADQHYHPHGTGVGRSQLSGLNAGSGGPSASSHPSSHSQSPTPGSYTTQTTNTTDVGSEMLRLLREATSSSSGGGRNTNLIEDYTDGHTMRTYYRSLKEPWNELPPDQGPVKEFHKVKEANKDLFSGNRLNYPVWRRRFIATVHMQRMLISDKALALASALDKKVEMLEQMVRGLHYDAPTYVGLIAELERLFGGADQEIATTVADLLKGPRIQLNSLDSVRGFRVKLASYRATLETYGERQSSRPKAVI